MAIFKTCPIQIRHLQQLVSNSGEPGAKTLWLGMRDLAVFVQGLRFARMAL